MALRLEYRDRYRLWSDLLRGTTDRMFVPTDERPTLGASATVEVRLAELRLPIAVKASVGSGTP